MPGACWSTKDVRATTILRPGLLAVVGAHRIDWVHIESKRLLTATPDVSLNSAAAYIASVATNEVLIVCNDGTLERVRIPV